MTPDMKYLVWSSALCMLQLVVSILGAIQSVGLPVLAGNRERLPAIEGWAGRAQRAHRNMLESLVVFAILVLVAQLAQRANATTALGAMIFFWSRLAFAGIYIAGITWVRTLAWGASLIGLLMIFSQVI